VSFDRRNYDAPGAGAPPARSLFEVGPPKPPPRGLFDVTSGNKDGTKNSGRSPKKEARGAGEPKTGKGGHKAPQAPLAPRALLTRPAAPGTATANPGANPGANHTAGSTSQTGLKATAAPFVFKPSAPSFVPGGGFVAAGASNKSSSSAHQDANADLRAAIGAKEFVPSFVSGGGGAAPAGKVAGGSNGGQPAAAAQESSADRPPQPQDHGQPSGGSPAPLAPASTPLEAAAAPEPVKAVARPPPPTQEATEPAVKSEPSATELDQDLEGFDDYDLNGGGDDGEVDEEEEEEEEEEILLSGNVP